MALFETKAERDAKHKVAIRLGKRKVSQYVSDCRGMGKRYWTLAKKAMALGDEAGCRGYVLRRHQYDLQANKFESFLLRMEDLSMRGEMSRAMTGLISGMQALNKQIRAGVSAKEMSKAMQQLQVTMAQLEGAEETMTAQMADFDVAVGTPAGEADPVSVPPEMAADVDRLMNDLRDEVTLEESTAQTMGEKPDLAASGTDERFRKSVERLREMRGRQGK